MLRVCILFFISILGLVELPTDVMSQNIPPKQQILALRQANDALQVEINKIAFGIESLIVANKNLEETVKNARRESSDEKKAAAAQARIAACQLKYNLNLEKIANLRNSIPPREVQQANNLIAITNIKESTNNEAVRIAVKYEKLEQTKAKTEYPRTRLPIPEAKLDEKSLRCWRVVQENMRKAQYIKWKIIEMGLDYEKHGHANDAWEGQKSWPRYQQEIESLKKEHDDLLKEMKSEQSFIRNTVKALQKEMKMDDEIDTTAITDEYHAWVRYDGKSMIAKFISTDGFSVTMGLPDGENVTFPINRLWVEDKKLIEQAHPVSTAR